MTSDTRGTSILRCALVAPVLLAGAIAQVSARPVPVLSLAGAWKVHTNVFGSESDRTCTFVRKDAELSGTCGADPFTGKVEGNRVTWQLKTHDGGKPLTLEFTGTANSDNGIVGSVNLVEVGVDGEFTAAKSK
jgi:hypothetical protein